MDIKNAVQQELDDRVEVNKDSPAQLPGVTAAIVLSDGQVLAFAAGKASLDPPVDMQITTRMPAGSVGKMFVAAMTMSLVSDNVLQLDEPIAQWLGKEPWFTRLPNHQSISLRHLLNHSSGLIDHVFDEGSEFGAWFLDSMTQPDDLALTSDAELDTADQQFDPVSLVQYALDREPLFDAGQGFHYSDTGYILIGLIIEKATGSTYYELLSKRFLDPLGLTLTSPQDQRRLADLAQGYAVESQAQLGLPDTVLNDGRLIFNPRVEWTGGGLVSNPQDLARWIMDLFSWQVLSSNEVITMLFSIVDQGAGNDATGQPFGYGLGVSVVNTSAGTVFRHGGFFPGYLSLVAFYPDRQIAIAMQINSDGADLEDHFDDVRDVVFAALDKLP